MNRVEQSRAELPRTGSVCHERPCDDEREHERAVLQAIRGTHFGTVEVTVHQSRIVQITRSEKLRF